MFDWHVWEWIICIILAYLMYAKWWNDQQPPPYVRSAWDYPGAEDDFEQAFYSEFQVYPDDLEKEENQIKVADHLAHLKHSDPEEYEKFRNWFETNRSHINWSDLIDRQESVNWLRQ